MSSQHAKDQERCQMITKREAAERKVIRQKLKKLFEPPQYEFYRVISKKKTLQDRVTDEALKGAAREIRKIAKEQGIALTALQAGDIAGLLVVGWKELISPLEIPDPPG
jgi:hypothetical protein